MDITIPKEVIAVYQQLIEAGFSAYFVGGCVRDMLLEKKVKDWDVTTNATPEQMLTLFPDAFYDNSFGTVGIPVPAVILSETRRYSVASALGMKNISFTSVQDDKIKAIQKHIVEVTTFRTERDYTDARHPSHVAWGKTIEEDLERRDFTMNAIALKLNPQDLLQYELVDPFHGQGDIKSKTIRAVGDPTKRFKEDALRLMRAIRFATQLQCTIEESTWKAIQEDSMLLGRVSGERIRDELMKILASDYPYEGLMLLNNANLLQHIIPELLEGQRLSQSRPGRHHVYDVFTHNLLALKLCPSKGPLVRFATMIHDIGKARVAGKDENGLVIFYNHEVAGARMAYEICERLHFSKKDRQKVVTLIRWHMFTVDEHITDSAVRRFIRRVGVENVKDMIDLRIGDRLGGGIPEHRAESWRLKKFKDRIEDQLKPAPFSINDLAVDGNDVMQTLQIKPGKEIGQILQKLFEEVDEDLSKNTREYLLERMKQIYK